MPPNVTRRILLLALAACALHGCAGAFRRAHAMTPGPGGAIAAAPLGAHRVAILAGTDAAKGVFVVDLDSARIVRSFGVTREAVAIGAAGPDGPVLLGIAGTTSDGHPAGSVESWTLQGQKQQVVPMSARALAMTQVVGGQLFVLVGDDASRAAVPLTLGSMLVGRAIPLDATTDTLALCQMGADALLVSSGPGMVVSARSIDTGQIVRSSVVADAPTCISGQARIYAISKTFLSRSVVVFGLPDMIQAASIPVSNDARALYAADPRGLLALNATRQVSNIQYLAVDGISAAASAAPK
jgi:hypothetical protein